MRILVVGGSGVIGRRLIPLLMSAGHDVAAVVHRRPLSPPKAGLRLVEGDLFEPSSMLRVMAGHDMVVNLATALPSATWKMPFRRAWRANDRIRTAGVANLVDCALQSGFDAFIQESFAYAYPDRGSAWIDEDIPLAPARYNRTVLDAERALDRFRAGGGRAIVMRFAAFFGADALQTREMVLWARRGFATLPGRGDAFVSSISHDDAAAAVAAAVGARGGVYNVGDDKPVTRAHFFGSLAEAMGIAAPRLLPEWSHPLFGSLGDAMGRSIRLCNARLKAETNWRPRWASVDQAWPEVVARLRRSTSVS